MGNVERGSLDYCVIALITEALQIPIDQTSNWNPLLGGWHVLVETTLVETTIDIQ